MLGKVKVYQDNPHPFRFFYEIIDENDKSKKKKIRFFVQYLQGSKVYYLETKSELAAYCVITKGGGKYSFSDGNDVVLSPFFVKKEYRGNHLAEYLIRATLKHGDFKYNKIYAWAKKTNIASCKSLHNCGLTKIATATLSNKLIRIFRLLDIKTDDSGDWILFCADQNTINWN